VGSVGPLGVGAREYMQRDSGEWEDREGNVIERAAILDLRHFCYAEGLWAGLVFTTHSSGTPITSTTAGDEILTSGTTGASRVQCILYPLIHIKRCLG